MSINIRSSEADHLIRELTQVTGESITDAVLVAVRERLERERLHRRGGNEGYAWTRVRRIQQRAAALPVLDARTADDILGYDEHGLPR